ncbi:hypothetical protein, partial [Arthrobacter sp. TS-15]|uniref:hypothetical protein n=1 Tax=Arthrobacter sp. TS-15 TaxID=2510797 RepID=UPI001EE7C6F0
PLCRAPTLPFSRISASIQESSRRFPYHLPNSQTGEKIDITERRGATKDSQSKFRQFKTEQ